MSFPSNEDKITDILKQVRELLGQYPDSEATPPPSLTTASFADSERPEIYKIERLSYASPYPYDVRQQAYNLLFEALEINEYSPEVWWFLAFVVDTISEHLTCLLNVLVIDHEHEKTLAALPEDALQAEQLLKQAKELLDKEYTRPKPEQSDDEEKENPWSFPPARTRRHFGKYIPEDVKTEAKNLLLKSIKLNDQSVDAWFYLSKVIGNNQYSYSSARTEEEKQKQICLQNVLTLESDHKEALQGLDLKTRIMHILSRELDIENLSTSPFSVELRRHIEELFNAIMAEQSIVLSRKERTGLFENIVAELIGLGPLEWLLADDSISAISITGFDAIHVERKGNWELSNIKFEDIDHLYKIIDRIVKPLQPDFDHTQQSVIHSRLRDGSQVDGVILPDPLVMIRTHTKKPLQLEDLIRFGSMTAEIAQFLRACVIANLNILIVGEAGAGKTSLTNVISMFIPNNERIITHEYRAALQLQQEHVVTLEHPDLIPLESVLHMRPDRIVFDELRSDHFAHLIESGLAINTWGSIRARDIPSALMQLEMGLLNAMPNLDLISARNMISQAFDVIICLRKLADGSRKIVDIAEVTIVKDGEYNNQLLYTFEQIGMMEGGRVVGRIRPTGVFPRFLNRIENAGIFLEPSIFVVGGRY